jgi:serine protease Do
MKDPMKLLDKMRQQKLLSSVLMVFTLSVGILIGTLVNTQVSAQRGQPAAPDATPLVVPKAVPIGNDFTALAKKLEASVVNINVEVSAKGNSQIFGGGDFDDDDAQDLFRRFFGQQSPRGQGQAPKQGPAPRRSQSGSGFIVDRNGYVITNNHVVEGAEKIRVKLHGDPMEYRAHVVGTDSETDLAVIKIDGGRNFTPVTIANSDAVQVGDWAVAIGSPFGLEATVTAGIVSATGRDINPGRQFQHFIQTDAAINPGNSGGPLLNIKGDVIGVNTMIATRTGGSEGVGFALPINMAVRVYNDLIKDGRVTRGSIGVGWNSGNSKPETLKALGVDHGVVVDRVEPNGPAAEAGVKKDDIILGINGKPIKDGDELVAHVSDLPVGTPITLNLDRDGKKMDVKLTIKDRTEVFRNNDTVSDNVQPDSGKNDPVSDVKFGIGTRPLTEAEKAGLPDKRGVAVARVEQDSFAEEIGMQTDDIIIAINRQPVGSREDIVRIQATLKPGDPVAFRVVRGQPQAGGRTRAKSAEPITLFLSGYLPRK